MSTSGFIFPEQDVFTCVRRCEYMCVCTHNTHAEVQRNSRAQARLWSLLLP